MARDAQSAAEWLCGHLFSGPGATLAFCENGFFALRLENSRKEVQNISGLWRLAPDGIGLSLMTLQDAQMSMSAGAEAIHAILPNLGATTLFPLPLKTSLFRITGLLTGENGRLQLEDAASGMVFPVPPTEGETGKFATAELEISENGAAIRRLLTHSRTVPRYFAPALATSGPEIFRDKVQERAWLLPPWPGLQAAALRLGPADTGGKGVFDITGPGLRLEGKYVLDGNKLTLAANGGNIKKLEILGLKSLADAFLAAHTWQHSSRGLELEREGKKILMLPLQTR